MASTRRMKLAGAVAVAAAAPALALAPAASAAGDTDKPLVTVAGGTTAVTLNPDTAELLTEGLGLDIDTTGHAFVDRHGALNFPVKPSELNPTTLIGQIEHRGGARFSAPSGESIKLSKFDINLDDADLADGVETSDLTAKVNRNRFDRPEVFDLDLSGANVEANGSRLKVSNVGVTLSEQGAAALNATFGLEGSSALPAGAAIGTAVVKTHIRGAKTLPSNLFLRPAGGTTVSLDPATVDVLSSLGLSIGIDGATVPTALGDVVFPIRGGRVASDSLAGRIRHIGQLELSSDSTTVELGRFVIDSKNGVLTGVVRANGTRVGRAPLFKLGLGDLQAIANGRDLRLSKVQLSLTQEAADLLNSTFGTDALTEGISIGTATADATVATRFSRTVSFF